MSSTKILRPSKAFNQMSQFELRKRKHQLDQLFHKQEELISEALLNIGNSLGKNYRGELTDSESHQKNKLNYEKMLLCQKAQKTIEDEQKLIDKYLESKLSPKICPKCNRTELTPCVSFCLDCSLKEDKLNKYKSSVCT